MSLADLVGHSEVDAIRTTGSIEFLAAGDTGKGIHSHQSAVVEAMAREFRVESPEKGATFFLNLGDIVYGPGKSSSYANKFYRPNMPWLRPAPDVDGLILAIPGNHDGEVRDASDNPSLKAFLENFCTAHAPNDNSIATSFNVKMPNQPGPYWWLSAPFLDVIGLYSNSAEESGELGVDPQDTQQQDWLLKSLQTIVQSRHQGERNALVIATHHPPYSQGLGASGRGHAGSQKMLDQIDHACRAAGTLPDLFLSGHSHNYQRYMRTIRTTKGNERVVPYLIAGTGGMGSQPCPPNLGRQVSAAGGHVQYANALGSTGAQHSVYGYLRVLASKTIIQATFVQARVDHCIEFETVAINLATGQRMTPDFDS